MTMYEIIQSKKRGQKLSKEEIDFFVQGVCKEEIPDYQAAALLMAIYFQGMDEEETYHLTLSMAASGQGVSFESDAVVADKHSTGGVSDATTLVIAPLVAIAGIKFWKMSGRALGHTGGTVDKLESIPNFNTQLNEEQIKKQINAVGAVIVGQTEKSAPADKKLYALRDVTATVDSIPLIAASIMSKKLLSPANILVLDVKYGQGAFLKSKKDADILSKYMTAIGKRAGRNVSCHPSPMGQPLGRFVGNGLEVFGAIEVLEGVKNPLQEQSFYLAEQILIAGGFSAGEAGKLIEEAVASGAAKQKFAQIVKAQGGDPDYILHKEKLLTASRTDFVRADFAGRIASIDCEGIGLAAVELGAGRRTKDDKIDYGAGIEILKREGESVAVGDKLCKLYYNKEVTGIQQKIKNCFVTEGGKNG